MTRPETPYDLGGTFDRGRYRSDRLLRGDLLHGVREGVRTSDDHPVLITVRLHDWDRYPLEVLRLAIPGIAPLLFCGPPDRYKPPKVKTVAGTVGAVIESRPVGVPLSDLSGRLHPQDIVRIGLGLCATIRAAAGGQAIRGIRPETVYVDQDGRGPGFSALAPRSILLLSHVGNEYGRAFRNNYDSPELWINADPSAMSDLFSAALTLWAAFTGSHAYHLTPKEPDEDVMARDDRGPFPGPPELARILEPILVADPSRRPSVAEVLQHLTDLAEHWRVEVSPFRSQ